MIMRNFTTKATSFRDAESGVSAIEFSLVAPVLILLLVGILDLGVYIYQQQRVNDIASASADYLSKGGTKSQLEQSVIAYYSDNPGTYSYTVDYLGMCEDGVAQSCTTASCPDLSCDDDGDYKRRYVSVAVSKTFQAILPYPGIADELELQANTRLRINE